LVLKKNLLCIFGFPLFLLPLNFGFKMELSNGEGFGAVRAADKSKNHEESNSKEKALSPKGSISSKDMFFRADKIDFKSLDIQLEKHFSRVWSREIEVNGHKEEWEIDLSKLDLRVVVAQGTYGTVYKGVYDGQDVAGNLSSHPVFLAFEFIIHLV
jgi:hypothetical protein